MTDLRELEKRLEEATGPDRLIDFEFAIMTDAQLAKDAGAFASVRYTNCEFMLFFEGVGGRGFVGDHMVPHASASLDAAVALVERVLPGWGYFIRKDEEGVNASLLYATALRVSPGGGQHQSSPALALCLALIRALIAKGDRHD